MHTQDRNAALIGIRRYLLTNPALLDLLGSDDNWESYVFRKQAYVGLEGTGKAMIVLNWASGWASPNMHNTTQFPTLQVEIYADPDRTVMGFPTDSHNSPDDRVEDVFTMLNPMLHWTVKRIADFNGVRVTNSTLAGEPDTMDVPDGDGQVRMTVNYQMKFE